MKKLTILTALVALGGVLAATLTAGAQTVVNGGFEVVLIPDSAKSGGYWIVGSGHAGVPDGFGWNVTGGNVELDNSNAWKPSEGAQSMDLNGDTAGTISQTITGLTIGQSYVISFDLASNIYALPDVKLVDVTFNGKTFGYTFDRSGHTGTNMGWSPQSFVTAATGTSSTLSFASTTKLSNDQVSGAGPVIDNIKITAITPEASSLLLLAPGLLPLGLALKRRRNA